MPHLYLALYIVRNNCERGNHAPHALKRLRPSGTIPVLEKKPGYRQNPRTNTYIVYPYTDSLNYGLSRGFKLVDVPQNFVFSYNYELPFGPGKRMLNSGIAGHVFGGWSINGITTFQSGQPLQITVANNLLNNNGGSNPANITCSSVPTPKLVFSWFDTSCFAAPPAYTFGNSGVGHVRGPGIHNWDFSVAKTRRWAAKTCDCDLRRISSTSPTRHTSATRTLR